METKEDIKHIVRVAKTDIMGSKTVGLGLTKIRGVGRQFAHMVCSLAGIEPNLLIGKLDESQAKRLTEAVENPKKFGAPDWMLNRRRDTETNEDMHLILGDLDFNQANDIKRMRKLKSYKGVRHSKGLPVRGQRTRSNFRRNKGKVTLGVKKKK